MSDFNKVIGYILYLMFVLLSVSVFSLIYQLKRTRDVIFATQGSQRDIFDGEIRTLRIILGVFSLTYVLRGLWSQLVDQAFWKYWTLISNVILGILFDFVPVTLLLCFHHRNYKRVATESDRGSDSQA